MDRRRAVQWAAIIGLVSAVIALGAAVLSLNNELEKSQQDTRAGNQRLAEYQQKLAQERAADEERRRSDLEAQRQALLAQQLANLCNEHAASRAAIDSRFADLMNSHGTMMNAIRNCARQPAEGDRSGCLATVCIGAAIWTSGQSNCLAIAADADAIRQDHERQTRLAIQDGCAVPSSQISSFFN